MQALIQRLYDEIRGIRLIDPHTHIQPRSPAATSLNDLLGYHYYTELAHSVGLERGEIESAQGLDQAALLVEYLESCDNTVQTGWLVEIARELLGFDEDEIDEDNIADVYALAQSRMASPDWTDEVFEKTGLDAVFLTNDFDDPLEGFDVKRYIPCLRTDDLVFHLDRPSVRERLAASTGHGPDGMEKALDVLFERFVARDACACAISLPPDFVPIRPPAAALEAALARCARGGALSDEDRRVVRSGVFYLLADRCEEYGLPFDLMIGVHRGVYEAGVPQGRDLFDQRTSLYDYRRLFNEKSNVTFPVSVLSHGQNQELAAYAWIFPNVATNGHWWYANIPAFIEIDARARLEAVPASKQIAYYSDAYKLEFVLPKFNMYRRCLARVLAEDFVVARRWSEERAVDLARTILRGNVERIFET
jgi:glucuronate isomerase